MLLDRYIEEKIFSLFGTLSMEKQFDHHRYQTELAHQWYTQNIYKASANKPLFSIDTPPPTVSGSLHIGHIFSYTHTDIAARYKRMRGYAVFYPFGFDDNGLATERFVEKKLNISAHQMSRSNFITHCLQETELAEAQFKKLWQTIGLSVDWSGHYSTISAQAQKISQESFIQLYQKNFIYRLEDPAPYCTTCRTTVAQAELDDSNKPSVFYDIAFHTPDNQPLVISTTRPELLPSCVALFFNPTDQRYQHLAGTHAVVPVYNYTVPILPDETVQIDKGTGLVMCCTFGDKTDVYWFKKHKLPYKVSLEPHGKWSSSTGPLAGLSAHHARIRIVELLTEQNCILKQRPLEHAVSVHERCKKEIEFIILSQWFLRILPYKQQFIEMAHTITWYPEFMKSRYINWVEALQWDWCLSRQRFYGIPFPVWYCKKNKHIILAQRQQLPLDPQETAYPGSCPECGDTDIIPDTDVMDTWNTSSLTPQICLSLYNKTIDPFSPEAQKIFLPLSMRPQAHDIIRTWAFYTMVKSWMHYDTIPWKDIVISGHVLSEQKEKISKSQGNSNIIPENLLQNYSADAVRFWTASGSPGQDIAFSENQLKIGQKLVTKLWNAFRFLVEHNISKQPEPQEYGSINEWILSQSSTCMQAYQKLLDAYEIHLALERVEQFFWHDFCDNYLELIKDQLFKPERYTQQEVTATRWTLYTVGLRILQLYAPYIPYITDALYQTIYKQHETHASIHQTEYDARVWQFSESVTLMEHVLTVVHHVRSLKTEKKLSLKTPLKELHIYASDEIQKSLKKLEPTIQGISQAEAIQYHASEKKNSELLQDQDSWNMSVFLE